MSLLAQKIIQKVIDKAIAKEAGREKEKTLESQADTYYNGIYIFGMDTYATIKISSKFMYATAIFFTLFGLIAEIFVAVLGILLGLFTYIIVKVATRGFGFVLYTNEYIKVFKKDGTECTTLSIAGLKNLEYKYPNYTFAGLEATAKVVAGGGEGFANFIDHLNERRPELVQTFFQNQNVSNAYYNDQNNVHTYNY